MKQGSGLNVLMAPALTGCLLLLAPVPAAFAQGLEDRTIFTFDSPVQVPGAVLPAGRYTFELVNPEQPNPSVVIRKTEGGQTLVTTVTIPIKRMEPEDRDGVAVSFVRTKGNQPPAIKSWFYAGERRGHVFVYPEKQARQIAGDASERVLSRDDSGATLFLVDASGGHHAYSSESQQGYLGEGITAESPTATAGTSQRAAAGQDRDFANRAEQHLDRIASSVQAMLSSGREAGTAGTSGERTDTVSISRDDLEAIQRHVEQLRRELERKK